MPRIGLPEILILIAICVLVFGGKRLGDIGRGLGEGIRNFRNAVKDQKHVEGEDKNTKQTS